MHSIPSDDVGMASDAILAVDRLNVSFTSPHGPSLLAVEDLSFVLRRGQTLGIVGESGSGKSQSVLAMMGLLARHGHATGRVMFGAQDLLALPASRLNRLRGHRIAMIFQDPMTALNPYLRVSRQMTEVLVHHLGLSRKQARVRAIAALEQVHITDAARRIDMYPHEFSGGMRQRVMIAMALLCDPDVLIADEPTTALDVTVQAEILALLRERQQSQGTSVIFITHDLGVVAELCDNVVVMYGGRVMEQANVYDLFAAPMHPYTAGLLASAPRMDRDGGRLFSIPGQPPDISLRPQGCSFSPRCTYAQDDCRTQTPLYQTHNHRGFACHHPSPHTGRPA